MGKHDKNHSKSRDYDHKHKSDSYKRDEIAHKESDNTDVFTIFDKYKHELNRTLRDSDFNVKNTEEFWTFLYKYQTVYKKSTTVYLDKTWNKTNLINFSLKKHVKLLYETLPVLDRNGHRLKITYDNFRTFLDIFLLYMDFRQKEKFAKLKKLRKTQSQLPVSVFREEIVNSVKENRVTLIAGDTGCGKSTQIPQYIQKAGFKKIVCTQPRRIACISLAKRVAHETLTEYNSTVGYQIRFEKTKRKDTSIIFITEGLLLRQASDEETLSSYDVVILDEVHERHLFGDFLIGIMKCLLYKRENLKLILMSATININLFSEYFSDEKIKVIQVPGRLYPIDIIYKPIIRDRFEKKTQKLDASPYLQVLNIIDEKYPKTERGDLLVFLSGIADITALSDAVVEYSNEKQNWIVLQLHSSLSLAEQDKVFDYPPEGVRKCIISTNIAETSVTIDGIRFVVDSGKVNKMSYNMLGGVNTLNEQYISQDSAKQRSGRAGRTGPGVCYRLYSEEEFNKFEAFTIAEIHLVPLETLVLHMVSLGLNNIMNFPFLEKPNPIAIKDAIEKLRFHGALLDNESLQLTSLGESLSRLPVDLTIGKMLILSSVFGNVTAVLCLAAAVSVQSPYTNKAYRNLDCENARKEFESNHGDPITLLNLFKEWLSIKQHSRTFDATGKHKVENSRYWTKKRGLEEQRFYEIMKLMTQFKDILQDSNLLDNNPNAEMSGAERSIRYGELKNLKRMRYELRNEQKSSQRKRLKHAQYNDEEDDDPYVVKNDIRDVEFKITNDYDTLQKLLNETSVNSYKDLTMLKLVLCSGLYPQIAVADEYNYCKSSGEQLFHTRNKNFVSLHPMSYFGNNSDVLRLCEDEIEVPPAGYFSKNPLSSKHKLLIYQSLLETTKVYLLNTMRMPALQTLLLFSKCIQTNATLTRFACDDFLMLDLPHVGQGKTLLLQAIKLRQQWLKLLNAKLQGAQIEDFDSDSLDLIQDLVHFMNTEVSYTMKRLLKADLKIIYNFATDECLLKQLEPNPFSAEFVAVEDFQFGGVKVTENVTYKCLIEDEWSLNLAEQIEKFALTCSKCDNQIYGTFLEKMKHEVSCVVKVEDNCEKKGKGLSKKGAKFNSKEYKCLICNNVLFLTPIEQLKHMKNCV